MIPTHSYYRLETVAIIQVIINDIFKYLIDTCNIANFINNMMIVTDSEKRHNKIVEKLLERMEKNNLYVKLEKYQWKIRVRFLEVVLELDRINIEKKYKKYQTSLILRVVRIFRSFQTLQTTICQSCKQQT